MDLTCLLAFPPLHQRIKLAIYCCNTRIMYLLRALPLATSDRHLQQYDTMFDNFMAQTLAFEDNYAHCQYSLAYTQALQQCRLGIKQGGLGLTSAYMVAPAALYVALREFRAWYETYADLWGGQALHFQDWLSAATEQLLESGAYFPYFDHHFGPSLPRQLKTPSSTSSLG